MKGEILIYDTIGGDWYYGYGVTAKSFLAQLNALNADKNVERITVRINSPGGSIADGIAIFNAITRNAKPVDTVNDGIAYSMAGLILMAGKKVSSYKNATTMLHNCLGGCFGNAKDFEGAIEMMKAIDDGMATSIAARTGLTVEAVKEKYFDYKDRTFTAQQALDEKLIDSLEDGKSEAKLPEDIASMSKEQVFAFFASQHEDKKEGFFSALSKTIAGAVSNIIHPSTTENKPAVVASNNNQMDFKNSISLLSKDALTAEDKAAIVNEIKAFTGENEKFSASEVTAKVNAAIDGAKAEAKTANDAVVAAKDAEIVKLKAAAAGGGPENPSKNGTDQMSAELSDENKKRNAMSHNNWAEKKLES